ncbi:MAG TPA: hypothetical protein PKE26_15635 [Kiritimatiellia bacterium]|nr:hypothetical protein [Kiritimatiellia bacterium]HMP00527.1 hypothetical protein [Kiritimatiellia bacterium]
MKHHASLQFWDAYNCLTPEIRQLADKNFDLLKRDSRHLSLQLKKTGRFWSARVGLGHRALAVECTDGLVWFWIGNHSDYDRLTT